MSFEFRLFQTSPALDKRYANIVKNCSLIRTTLAPVPFDFTLVILVPIISLGSESTLSAARLLYATRDDIRTRCRSELSRKIWQSCSSARSASLNYHYRPSPSQRR